MWTKVGKDNPGTKYMSEEKEWSVDVILDKQQALEWDGMEYSPSIRETENGSIVKLKRSTTWGKGGEARDPAVVVDLYGNTVDATKIGNGTIANVQYSVRNWEYQGKKGTTASLVAIQVIELKEFTSSDVKAEFTFSDIPNDEVQF